MHIAIFGAPVPSIHVLGFVNLLEYVDGVMKKLGFMWVVCLVLVVVLACVCLASGNMHIEHFISRIMPKFVFYELAFVPGHSVVKILWGRSWYYFHLSHRQRALVLL